MYSRSGTRRATGEIRWSSKCQTHVKKQEILGTAQDTASHPERRDDACRVYEGAIRQILWPIVGM
jgi:hypothetical protein